jgi:hypothetical protein
MAKPDTFTMATGTIAAGTSITGPIDCSAGVPVMLVMPPDWDYAPISFQVAIEGYVDYVDVFDSGVEQVVLEVMPGGRESGTGYIIPPGVLDWAQWIKVRSGTRSDPVDQSADRTFSVVLAVFSVVLAE